MKIDNLKSYNWRNNFYNNNRTAKKLCNIMNLTIGDCLDDKIEQELIQSQKIQPT